MVLLCVNYLHFVSANNLSTLLFTFRSENVRFSSMRHPPSRGASSLASDHLGRSEEIYHLPDPALLGVTQTSTRDVGPPRPMASASDRVYANVTETSVANQNVLNCSLESDQFSDRQGAAAAMFKTVFTSEDETSGYEMQDMQDMQRHNDNHDEGKGEKEKNSKKKQKKPKNRYDDPF